MNKIKHIIILVFLLGLAGCATWPQTSSKQKDSTIIETSILWQAKINKVTWEPIKLTKLLRNSSRFSPAGNFYEVKDETEAFGAKVIFIGLIGINFARGPNAVIQSPPKEIADYISKKYGIIFISEPKKNAYLAELKEYFQLLIIAHPSIENASIIIGEYTGL